MNKDTMILRKALSLSYVYSKLTLENLDVAVHEMSLLKSKDAKRLKGQFNKLTEATHNAFKILERNVSLEEVEALKKDLSKIIDVSWEENNNG